MRHWDRTTYRVGERILNTPEKVAKKRSKGSDEMNSAPAFLMRDQPASFRTAAELREQSRVWPEWEAMPAEFRQQNSEREGKDDQPEAANEPPKKPIRIKLILKHKRKEGEDAAEGTPKPAEGDGEDGESGNGGEEVRVRVRVRMEISSGAGKSEAWSIFAEVL
jgi:hypothetical protein